MKNLITLLLAVMMTAGVCAQAPEKITYQAVVRDADGALLAQTVVGLQISILKASVDGASVYVEMHQTTTNANGLLTVLIGDGTALSGRLSDVDWADGPYFLKSETDLLGGEAYSITGIDPILAVPYALHATTAERLTGPVEYHEKDSIFLASEAAKVSAEDILKLSKLSGVNSGDQDLSALLTYSALGDSIDGLRGEMPLAISDLLLEADAQCIANVADPKAAQDVATKAYVDSLYARVMYLFELRNLVSASKYDFSELSLLMWEVETALGHDVSVSDMLAVGVPVDSFLGNKYDISRLLSEGITFSKLIDAGLSLYDLEEQGYVVGDMIEAGVTLQELFSIASVCDLLNSGISFPALVDMGLSIEDVRQASSSYKLRKVNPCSVVSLIAAGVELEYLLAIGAEFGDFYYMKSPILWMLDHGMSISDIISIGGPVDSFQEVEIGYDSIMAAGAVSLEQLVGIGVPVKVFDKYGISIDSLLSEGVTLLSMMRGDFEVEDFQVQGYSLLWMYEQGMPVASFLKAGVSMQALCESGIPIIDILDAGLLLEDLLDAGLSLSDLVKYGLQATDLIGRSYGGGVLAYILQEGDAGYVPGEVHGLIASTQSIRYLSKSAAMVGPSEQAVEEPADDVPGDDVPDDLFPGDDTPEDLGPNYDDFSIDDYLKWNCGDTSKFALTSTALGTGAANTKSILSTMGVYALAVNCCVLWREDMDLEEWYMPSKDELNKLYENRVKIGGFDFLAPYWSSSEMSKEEVWIQYFVSGRQAAVDKGNACRVRPVRSF